MLAKTKILTLSLFGFLFLNLSAQDGFENDPVAKLPDEDRTFRLGLHFSPNLSWFKANTAGYDSDGSAMGFSYGLSFEYFLSNNYLISSGLELLHGRGALRYRTVAVNPVDFVYQADAVTEYKNKYINIPTVLKLRTNEIGYFTYYAKFGLTSGFNFSSSAETKLTYNDTHFGTVATNTFDDPVASSQTNWINISMVIGAGVEYNISGNTSAVIGITFNNGFVNQLDSKQIATDSNGDVLFTGFGKVEYTDKNVSANLNYLALNLGIYF